MNNTSPESIRRRQWIIAGGAVAIVVGLVALYFWAARPTPPLPPEERVRKTLASTGKLDERTAWRAKAEADVSELAADQKNTSTIAARLEAENKDLLARLAALEKSGLTAPPPAPVPSFARETEPRNPISNALPLPPAGSQPAPRSRAQAMATPLDRSGFLSRGAPPGAPGQMPSPVPVEGGGMADQPGLVPQVRSGIVTLTWDKSATAVPATTSTGGKGVKAPVSPSTAASPRNSEDTPKAYLPSGSFMRGDLLMGLDAPTGGQTQRNPQPVLIRITNHAYLPSRLRGAVKDCFVVGAAYGDQSAERAYIRTETMSCIGADNRAFDGILSATVAGEDGKVGLRGKLVQKQGAILQQALLASVASGIGQAFRSSGTTQSISALGSTATVQPGEEFKAGFSTGISGAADRLANYWISLAEKLHPVVEIDAGRSVTVVLTSGLTMDLPKQEDMEDIE